MTVLDPVDRSAAGAEAPPPGTTAAVSIDAVTKRFGNGPSSVLALDGISLRVTRGEFVCIVGASGCGKSTLLSLVAGLDRPTSGSVTADGRTALMFQDAALLPWHITLPAS